MEDRSGSGAILRGDLRFVRIMLGLQVVLGLFWGVLMLFFARQIGVGVTARSLPRTTVLLDGSVAERCVATRD